MARFGLEGEPRMVFVESFRGRRGWHVVFHYRVDTKSVPQSEYQTGWFPRDALPRTMHGRWEHDSVKRVLEQTTRCWDGDRP